jgi:hypothetical protein
MIDRVGINNTIQAYDSKNTLPRILKSQLGANLLKNTKEMHPPNIEVFKVDFKVGYTMYNMTLSYKGKTITNIVLEYNDKKSEYSSINETIRAIKNES